MADGNDPGGTGEKRQEKEESIKETKLVLDSSRPLYI